MTLFSPRARVHFGAFATFLLVSTQLPLAHAADEAVGGTFNAPGYADAAASTPARNARTPQDPAAAGGRRPGTDDDTLTLGRRNDPRLAPPKPSEFQKFVEVATGRQLPVFGASFFNDAAPGLASVDNIPVSSDYTVSAGDEVLVRAWGAIDVDYRARVDRNGQINLPKVGSFTVTGVKASELEKHLRAQIGRLYTNFNLSVALGQLRGVKVFVVGPARVPGVYTVPSQSTMLSAVVAAGGPGPNGSMRKVQLRRDGSVLSELDIYDFLVQGDKSKDVQLAPGDVVVFQPVGPRVALTGAVDAAAIYELKSAQEPVQDLLRYAGSSLVLANPHKVHIERIDPTQAPAARYVEEFKLDAAGRAKPLRDGDVMTLLAISPQFANAVTLKGQVAQPLRYAYTPGMRIRDLIPDKEALVSPDFYRRKNLLVQAIEEDEAGTDVADAAGPLGATAGAGTPRSRSAAERAQRETDRLVTARAKKAPAALFEDLNWDYAVIERLNADLSTQVIPFNLGKAVLQGDEASNLELMPGDVVTVYGQKDMRVPVARQTRLVSVEGEVGAPGVYQLLPGETLPQLVERAGGFTAQAYVYGLEFSREETRQRQRENLTAAMARLEALSATQAAREAANKRDDNVDRTASVSAAATQAQMARLSRLQPSGRIALELKPTDTTVQSLPAVSMEHGDRIVVPSRPSFITVAGAVVNNNALLWKQGRLIGDYLKQAGVDEAAEPDNMFVLRADGTVVHAGDFRGFLGFGGGIGSQPALPGDAIIVPTQLDFETWGRAFVRNMKDFGQIFYQFGLGAAAIQTLRKN